MNSALIKPAWSPVSIALMVLGFIIFWPLGAAVLAYILWGEYGGGSKDKAEAWMKKTTESVRKGGSKGHAYKGFASTGNAAFDAYRDETLKRLEDEHSAFLDFLQKLREARDKAEFDQFMEERRQG